MRSFAPRPGKSPNPLRSNRLGEGHLQPATPSRRVAETIEASRRIAWDFSEVPVYPLDLSGPASFEVGEPGDPAEQQADRLADRALAAPARPFAEDAVFAGERLPGLSKASTALSPAGRYQARGAPGYPLGPGLRRDMERLFRGDFSTVRVHTNPAAARSAEGLRARAYTIGSDIVFAAGQLAPETRDGRWLIAHELAHVVQQRSSPLAIQRQPTTGGGPPPIDPFLVYDQIDIVKEEQLPLEFFRIRANRRLSFAERRDLEFHRKLQAIITLGDMRNERAVKVLIAVVEDTLPQVQSFDPQQKELLQQEALSSLAKIGSPAALTKLRGLLNSKKPEERKMASRALHEAGPGQAVTDLLAALKTETDAAIKSQIVSDLGTIGGASTNNQEREAIAKALIDVMQNNVADLESAAVIALGKLKSKTATDPLLSEAKQHLGIDRLVEDVAISLGEIGDDKAVELLVILLGKHPSNAVRSASAIALGKIGGAKAVAALKTRLGQETDARVKADIAKALGGTP